MHLPSYFSIAREPRETLFTCLSVNLEKWCMYTYNSVNTDWKISHVHKLHMLLFAWWFYAYVMVCRTVGAIWFEFRKLTTRLQKNKCSKKQMLKKVMPMKYVTLEEFYQRKLHPSRVVPLLIHNLKNCLTNSCPRLSRQLRATRWKSLKRHRNSHSFWWH